MDKVSHFEIPTDDLERAKKFYKDVFGWGIVDMPKMNYTIVHTGKTDAKGMLLEKGAINGGMMKRGMIRYPVITIIVENMDKAIEKVRRNGGSIFSKKMEVEKMGYAAYIRDTEGNIMGLFQPTTNM